LVPKTEQHWPFAVLNTILGGFLFRLNAHGSGF